MTAGFGTDFRAARSSWLYSTAGTPPLWVAALVAIGMVVLLTIMQSVTGLAAFFMFFGGFSGNADPAVIQSDFAKAAMVGLFPAGLAVSLAAWFAAKGVGSAKPYGLPLHVPDMGIAGWVVLVLGFCATVLVIYFGLFAIAGIDPSTYLPSQDGLGDAKSSAGLVEKALADLADEPLLFALALPGVALAVPISEELIFRGPLFSALAQSRVGRVGAVVITSALWAAIHVTAPWMFIAIIFCMGLILGLLLLRFGSVLVTIVCHCLWNSYSALAILGGVAQQ